MNNRRVASIIMLFMTSFIWGTSFVAQILGMQYIGPFTFCTARYTLSTLVMIPVAVLAERYTKNRGYSDAPVVTSWRGCMKSGAICGAALFLGTGLQQTGLLFTTAGKAAFITALYIVIVPIYGLFMKKIPSKITLCAIVLSTAGLYLLSIKDGFSILPGDAIVLIGAFFWAAHIIACDKFARGYDAIKLSTVQFGTVALLSSVIMIAFEAPEFESVIGSWRPIAFAGIIATGVAYTFQMIAQKNVSPVTTCIILSAEALFAALSGYLFLGERLSTRELIGCAVLLTATVMAQVQEIGSPRGAKN